MSDYIKTFATECHGMLLEALNDNTSISPECVQVIDTDDGNITFQFDSTLSGAEQTILDNVLSAWSCPEDVDVGNVDSFIDTQDYKSEETKIITLPRAFSNMVIHVMDPNVVETVGATLISPKGTGWDPGSVSTTIASINNGVFTDLSYNNSSPSNTEGIILGIDMGSAVTINTMKRWDYSTSYYDKHWEFIGTNNSDGSNYEVIFEIEQKAPFLDPNPFMRAFTDKTYRYFGCRCSESFNASYTIIRELELYSGGELLTVEKKLSNMDDYVYTKISPTEVSIKNLSAEEKTLKLMVMGS